jgi:hypothetical protein
MSTGQTFLIFAAAAALISAGYAIAIGMTGAIKRPRTR